MSNQDNNNELPGSFLINNYAKTTSRLNKNWLNSTANKNSTLSQPSSVQPGKPEPPPAEEKKDKYQNLRPKKVSELSSSVIFQDADGVKAESSKIPQGSQAKSHQ